MANNEGKTGGCGTRSADKLHPPRGMPFVGVSDRGPDRGTCPRLFFYVLRGMYRCGRTIEHLTVGEFTVTGDPLFLSAFRLSSWEMDGGDGREGRTPIASHFPV